MAISNELREALAKRRQSRYMSASAGARKVVTDRDILDHGTGFDALHLSTCPSTEFREWPIVC